MLTGFEGWLGAMVVASHLEPIIISLHMLFALVIVSLQMYALIKLKLYLNPKLVDGTYSHQLPTYLIILWVATIVEILLGTHMREGIEMLVKSFPGQSDMFLMNTLGAFKYIHTVLGIILVSITAIIWNKVMIHSQPHWVVIIITRILVGIFIFQIVMEELMVFGTFFAIFPIIAYVWVHQLAFPLLWVYI